MWCVHFKQSFLATWSKSWHALGAGQFRGLSTVQCSNKAKADVVSKPYHPVWYWTQVLFTRRESWPLHHRVNDEIFRPFYCRCPHMKSKKVYLNILNLQKSNLNFTYLWVASVSFFHVFLWFLIIPHLQRLSFTTEFHTPGSKHISTSKVTDRLHE